MAQAQAVQATCPGCKSVLRIPADWLDKPIRCKNCGTVVQARKPASPPTPPAVPAQTTIPKPRPGPVVPPPAPRNAPPPAPAIVPPPLAKTVIEPPASPLMAFPVPAAAPTTFEFDDSEPDATPDSSPTRARRPKKKGGGWAGLAVLGGIVLTLAVLGLIFQGKIRKGIQTAISGKAPVEEEGVDPDKASSKGKSKGPVGAGTLFPRRAMIISVHNYLYANPIVDAPTVDLGPPNLARLINSLNLGLRIPLTQIVQVSDGAKKPLPPLRKVIEEALVNFLTTSRKQDRIMVFFIGHAREIENKAYLVPLEGEFDNVETLIPLQWVYDQLAKCPARQKILVIDGNRFNASQGEERPAAGPLGPKFEAMLKAPPAGVQVMTACSAGQQSLEFDESSLGVFLESFRQALTAEKGKKAALEGKIQHQDDLIPIDVIFKKTKEIMAEQVEKRKLKQVALLAGAAPSTGAEFDPKEKAADLPAMPVVRTGDLRLVKEIMNDISLPPLKGGVGNSTDVAFSQLPPFPEEKLQSYQGGQLPAESLVRKAVNEARVTLWAISTATVPPDILTEVQAVREKLRVDLSVMRDRYPHPPAGPGENQFKERVGEDSKAISRVVLKLEQTLDNLTRDEVKEELKEAPKRWKANYNFVIARFNAQMAYLEEYNGLLGQMRKAFPDPVDADGWKMASKEKPGDSMGKKYDKEARKLFTQIAEKNANTPWAVLSKREKLTALGLDWAAY